MIPVDPSSRHGFLLALAGSVAVHVAALAWADIEQFAAPRPPTRAAAIEVTLAVFPATREQRVKKTRAAHTPAPQPARAAPPPVMALDGPGREQAMERPPAASETAESSTPPGPPVAPHEASARFAAAPENRASEPQYVARYLYNPPPQYPREARRRGIEGRVVLRVEILETGTAGRIEIRQSSGHDMLDQTALEAVSGWRFAPARAAGTAITAWADVPISFRLIER